MNQRYNKSKIFAFTLAEMMVILLVFSVIAAATLPVVSMRQKLRNVDNNAMSDYPGVDKWSYSQIGSTGQYALSNIGAGVYSTVAIGMEPTAADVPLGTKPQLMINKNGEVTRTSHITFLGTMGSNVYYNGRLSMAGENLALGNDALWSTQASGAYVTGVGKQNIAIGTQAVYRYPLVTTTVNDNTKLQDTIAIGYKAFFGGTGPYNVIMGNCAASYLYGGYNVIIGNYAANYGTSTNAQQYEVYSSVILGSYASYQKKSGTAKPNKIRNGVYIGNYSGYQQTVATSTTSGSISIGTYAESRQQLSSKQGTVINIGYGTGMNLAGGLNANPNIYGAINIGFLAGAYDESPTRGPKNSYSTINIGTKAGYGFTPKIGDIYHGINIGAYVGLRSMNISSSYYYPINIGSYAGLEESSTRSINIGFYAGSYDGIIGDSDYFINIGTYASSNHEQDISIGYYAGVDKAGSGSGGDICIGYKACKDNYMGSRIINIGKQGPAMSYSNYNKARSFWYPSVTSTNSIKYEFRLDYLFDYLKKGSTTKSKTQTYSMYKDRSYIGYYPRGDLYEYSGIVSTPSTGTLSGFQKINNFPWAPTGPGLSAYPDPQIENWNDPWDVGGVSQFLISGGNLQPEDSGYNYSKTSILLYSSHLYGPKSTFETYSDKRLKKNIVKSRYSLKDLRKINIYEYNFKEDKEKSPRIGVIAQELQKIIPQAVTNINDGYLAISAEWINYTVVNSIKELASQIDVIQKEFTSYVKEFVTLVARVNTLEKQIKNLEQENKVLLTSVDKAYRKAKARK